MFCVTYWCKWPKCDQKWKFWPIWQFWTFFVTFGPLTRIWYIKHPTNYIFGIYSMWLHSFFHKNTKNILKRVLSLTMFWNILNFQNLFLGSDFFFTIFKYISNGKITGSLNMSKMMLFWTTLPAAYYIYSVTV